MPHTLSNYVNHGPWDDNIKIEARYKTIIEMYRKVFEVESIPKEAQYWTMCGAHYNRNKSIMGELGNLVKSKLILPEQFYGVDKEEKIINTNRKLYPNINWINNDFLKAISKQIIKKQFNPAIINYDGVMQPKYGVDYLKKLFITINNNVSDQLLLISNFVLTNPYTKSKKLTFNINDIIKELMDIYWIPDYWYIYPQGFKYKHNQTQMGTIVFIKEKHEPGVVQYTQEKNNFWRKD